MRFGWPSKRKKGLDWPENRTYKAFLVSPNRAGEKFEGRHRGAFVCLGGQIHDTSSAWELNLLHQGRHSCLAVGSWLDGRAVTHNNSTHTTD